MQTQIWKDELRLLYELVQMPYQVLEDELAAAAQNVSISNVGVRHALGMIAHGSCMLANLIAFCVRISSVSGI